jgi:hypothetical protein
MAAFPPTWRKLSACGLATTRDDRTAGAAGTASGSPAMAAASAGELVSSGIVGAGGGGWTRSWARARGIAGTPPAYTANIKTAVRSIRMCPAPSLGFREAIHPGLAPAGGRRHPADMRRK